MSGYSLLHPFLSSQADFLLHVISVGAGDRLFLALSIPDPPRATLPFSEHIYKEIVSFSPIARKDSRRRSGMKLQ